MRQFSVRSSVWCAVLALTLVVSGAAMAAAEETPEKKVRTRGGSTRFSTRLRDIAAARTMVENNRAALQQVLTKAGLGHVASQIINTLASAEYTDVTIAPQTQLSWMALKRRGTPDLLWNVRWVGARAF